MLLTLQKLRQKRRRQQRQNMLKEVVKKSTKIKMNTDVSQKTNRQKH